MINLLPAGLRDHQYEFFVDQDGGTLNAFCLTQGRVIPFEDFPDDLLYIIRLQITLRKLNAVLAMGITGERMIIKQFLICNYGGFDHEPDMKDGILQPAEFWPCPKRGSCPQEGILCDPLRTTNGRNLSAREVDVIKLIARGLLNKEIAGHLDIEEKTVASHTKNIRLKTGFSRKTDIAVFATQKQLI